MLCYNMWIVDNNYGMMCSRICWIREGCTKRNVTIGVRYVHETLRLGYIPECYG